MNTSLAILHLERREDRLRDLMEELSHQQITDYTIIPAFYNKSNPKLSINQGHKFIIQLAKEQGMENCIIAEDDICFTAKGAWQYFLSQIPQDYDMFCGLILNGEVRNNRIMSGMSGTQTLYSVHSRFYDIILQLDANSHIDRNLGSLAQNFKYLVCDPMCCIQRGGYSDNLRMNMYYDVYLEGKKLFGR